MGHLLFLTGNEIKYRNAKRALGTYGIEVEQIDVDMPEIQSTNVREVAEFSARYAGKELNKPVVKLDVAFEIRALNGFPGPFVKFINQWLSTEKMLRLMENETDRYAKFTDFISIYEPDTQNCVNFLSETPGQIADEVQGDNGWGIDRIFVPHGYNKTLASYTDEEKADIWNHMHWRQLAEYLIGRAQQG